MTERSCIGLFCGLVMLAPGCSNSPSDAVPTAGSPAQMQVAGRNASTGAVSVAGSGPIVQAGSAGTETPLSSAAGRMSPAATTNGQGGMGGAVAATTAGASGAGAGGTTASVDGAGTAAQAGGAGGVSPSDGGAGGAAGADSVSAGASAESGAGGAAGEPSAGSTGGTAGSRSKPTVRLPNRNLILGACDVAQLVPDVSTCTGWDAVYECASSNCPVAECEKTCAEYIACAGAAPDQCNVRDTCPSSPECRQCILDVEACATAPCESLLRCAAPTSGRGGACARLNACCVKQTNPLGCTTWVERAELLLGDVGCQSILIDDPGFLMAYVNDPPCTP